MKAAGFVAVLIVFAWLVFNFGPDRHRVKVAGCRYVCDLRGRELKGYRGSVLIECLCAGRKPAPAGLKRP